MSAAAAVPSDLDFMGSLLERPWKRYRKALKRCQRKFSPKAIHDFRVETRRLLSSLELLESLLPARRVEKVHRLLKRRLDLFDDLRDTQVQLATLAKMPRALPAARSFHAGLRKREQRFARRTRKQIRGVKARRLGKLVAQSRKDVEKRLEKSPPRKALEVLLRSVDLAFRRARELRARINPREATTIHRTRVAFKRFRYMLEALAACLPGVTRQRLGAMRRYQTMMGNIQDAEVLLRALDRFLSKEEAAPEAMRRFRGELVRRRQRLIRSYLAAADRLAGFWPLPRGRATPTPTSAPRSTPTTNSL